LHMAVLEKTNSVKEEWSSKEMPALGTLQMHCCDLLQSTEQSLNTIRGNVMCNHEALLEQIDTLVQLAWQVEMSADTFNHKNHNSAITSDLPNKLEPSDSKEYLAKVNGDVSKQQFLPAQGNAMFLDLSSRSTQSSSNTQPSKPQPVERFNMHTSGNPYLEEVLKADQLCDRKSGEASQNDGTKAQHNRRLPEVPINPSQSKLSKVAVASSQRQYASPETIGKSTFAPSASSSSSASADQSFSDIMGRDLQEHHEEFDHTARTSTNNSLVLPSCDTISSFDAPMKLHGFQALLLQYSK